jgi:hypothetical protein
VSVDTAIIASSSTTDAPNHRIPPPKCRGISNGFFGQALTFAARSMQPVEWFFCDARQMVGGSSNKLTAAGFDQADKKASTFNYAKFSLVGNNSTGHNVFGRNKRF